MESLEPDVTVSIRENQKSITRLLLPSQQHVLNPCAVCTATAEDNLTVKEAPNRVWEWLCVCVCVCFEFFNSLSWNHWQSIRASGCQSRVSVSLILFILLQTGLTLLSAAIRNIRTEKLSVAVVKAQIVIFYSSPAALSFSFAERNPPRLLR